MYRTHNCGELNIEDINKKVILSGWIHKIRKMKKYYFIDLRDYYGITQLIIKKKKIKKIYNEYLIKIKGIVYKRLKKNKLIKTGEIEVHVYKIFIINKSKFLPFNIEDNPKINKKIRLKYRYLDLRRNEIKNNLIKKFKIINNIRNFFLKEKFIELDTPFLVNNTSEGARNFIIPSRNNKGFFYSLPQSPQIFKQLLMIGGFDKYFQIVKCFRDEDFRKDRQPEFTQLDIEMSFINKNNIFLLIEKLIKYLIKKFYYQKIINFKKISYKESIKYYNTDKPDFRYKIYNIKLKNKFFKKKYIKYSKIIFIIPNFLNIKNIKINKIKILINFFLKKFFFFYLTLKKEKVKKIIKKKKYIKNIINKLFFSEYDSLIIILYKKKLNFNYKLFIKKINNFLLYSIYTKNILIPIWIINFPLFKYNFKKKKINSFHHPFTSPKKKISKKNLFKIKSKAYDLIINGIEIGSGSIRINNKKLQEKIFYLLKIKKKDIYKKFGFFLNSLEYGTPPHGGIGIGIERLILLILNKNDIRDLIPFPKSYNNKDIMLNTPSKIENKKLLKLNIKIIN
ncbi:MAG: aspartate--tRNA ligase [Candidatus Shikimatogenerans bostrichidophilus]|nr:MAG: aspartate--tRNA ligase [Candidatus Shikimatogenerans bostrichidophilus]